MTCTRGRVTGGRRQQTVGERRDKISVPPLYVPTSPPLSKIPYPTLCNDDDTKPTATSRCSHNTFIVQLFLDIDNVSDLDKADKLFSICTSYRLPNAGWPTGVHVT